MALLRAKTSYARNVARCRDMVFLCSFPKARHSREIHVTCIAVSGPGIMMMIMIRKTSVKLMLPWTPETKRSFRSVSGISISGQARERSGVLDSFAASAFARRKGEAPPMSWWTKNSRLSRSICVFSGHVTCFACYVEGLAPNFALRANRPDIGDRFTGLG